MNIGIIASSNGSVFKELYNALECIQPNKYSFFVVLDRDSELIEFCKKNEIKYKLILEQDNTVFCKNARDFLDLNNVTMVYLFFLRLVTEDIYDNYLTYNLHPSLLPDYKGFNAIESAFKDNSKYIGATLHRVDENVDGGDILIQIMKLMPKDNNINDLYKISFLQKTLLLFIMFDYIDSGNFDDDFKTIIYNSSTSPLFYSTQLKELFLEIQARENYWIIDV